MEIEPLVKKMKDIYSFLIYFIDATDDSNTEFQSLIEILEKQKISKNQEEIKLLFSLISKLADNHHRTPNFFDKIEKIFQYLTKDVESTISYFIPDYTKYNKRIIFLLLEKKFIKPDESFINQYLQNKPNWKAFLFSRKLSKFVSYYYYLYPIMKDFLEEQIQKQIEKEIFEQLEEEISIFEEKCHLGENDSYICSLIRSDSVEEFISYVNRTNLSLLSTIKPSIYETNSFLINNETTLIEYAAFFGSIQIIQYLKYNNVPLTFSLWLYAIHSNNPELIHFLEENDVKPEQINGEKESFDKVLIESIKCHHNDITNYIKDKFYEQIQADNQNQFYDMYIDKIVNALNFFFFPDKFSIENLICKTRNEFEFNLSRLYLSLTKVTIPSSVTSIGAGAFYNCSSLIQIAIPSSVTSIGDSAFRDCSSLTQIIIPSSVTLIGNYAFSGCSSLTKIIIPSSVTLIGNYAFSGCSSLTKITIPSSVTSIGDYAFSGCSSLTQITIPSSIILIGNNTFNGCDKLEKFTIIPCEEKRIEFFEDKFLVSKSVTSKKNYDTLVWAKPTQNILIIPSFITKIVGNAFRRWSSLTQIVIPSFVTLIGDFAFSGCSSLAQITFEDPSSVTSIGDSAFSGCSSLTQITIPSSVTSIGNSVFNGCSSLTQIAIPSSVTSIGNYNFYGCSSLKQISISSSVTSFDEIRNGIRSEANIIYVT